MVDKGTLKKIDLDKLHHAITIDPLKPLSRLKPSQQNYFRSLIEAHGGVLPLSKITLSSIHRIKGDEAELVILIPDLTKQSWETWQNGSQAEQETENRNAFVAVTRSKNRLVLVKPKRRKFYPYRDYI